MKAESRKLLYFFNWPLLLCLMALLAMGLVNLYSATSSPVLDQSNFFDGQLKKTLVAFALLGLTLCLHYRHFRHLAWPFYFFSLILLIVVPFWGEGEGQRNWLNLGVVRLQPSELAKLSLIFILADYFAKNPIKEDLKLGQLAFPYLMLIGPVGWLLSLFYFPKYNSLKKKQSVNLLIPLLLILLPLGLTMVEKDFGSAIFFIGIGGCLYFLAGVPKRFFFIGFLLLGVVGLSTYLYIDHSNQKILEEYQLARIKTFLNPEQDQTDQGYHLAQSKIAVGSGQVWGKGYQQGMFNKLKYVPARHTDFIFPVLAEEWGFVGSLIFLICFAIFFLLMIQAAFQVRDPFSKLFIAGVCIWLFGQFAINVAGVLGLMPLAGVTLPFFSYGGSSLMTLMIAMGLVMNVYMRRYLF